MTNATIPSGIRGVSEERRTPRLGKIRLGKQVPNSKGAGTHPVMSPYFVFDADTAAGAALYEAFGHECTEIPVAFPSDDPSEFARRNLEMWGAGTLKCRGNGVEALALVNPTEFKKYQDTRAKARELHAEPPRQPVPEKVWASTARAGNKQQEDAPEPVREVIPCFGLGYDGEPACPKFANGKDCKASMHLQVIVRGFPGLGIFQIDSGSVVNIQRLDDFLAYLGNFTGGRFAMVPLLMRLEPYDMRGRKYYGLTFAVDFAAMQATGIGALPGVSDLSITERVVRFLPPESARPADARLLAAGTVEDEPPVDVDPETGEILEGTLVEDEEPTDPTYVDESDDAEPEDVEGPTGEAETVPVSPQALQDASALVKEVAEATNAPPEVVLSGWGADYVEVAGNLDAYRERFEQWKARKAAKAGAAS